MKITAYDAQHNIDLSGGIAITSSTYTATHTALGSNTPLVESGAGAPGSGPQASAWDHVHPAAAGASSSNSMTRTQGGQGTAPGNVNISGTHTINLAGGNYFERTLTGNTTIGFSNWAASGSLSEIGVRVTENGTGGYTPTFTGVTWIGGSAPAHTTTAGSSTEYVFWSADGGATIIGGQIGSGGSSLTINDEGSSLDTAVTSIDFVGAGVTATNVSHAVTVTIPTSTVTVADISALGFVGPILISDSAVDPLVFGDLIVDDTGLDLVYQDL